MINCVYIHVPFCEKKCKYCSFCSFQFLKKKKEYLEALKKEIKHYYQNEFLKTLYFGGGTPSLLEIDELKEIISLFNIDEKTEITIEINPNNISKEKIQGYKNLKINRLSLGVQTFDDLILEEIGRKHTKNDVLTALKYFREFNFDNFSIDLIYGLPNQNIKHWGKTLRQALELNPAHISLYGLKIEDGTYYKKYPPKNIASTDEQASMYELAIEILSEKYNHYEFSNFARSEKYYSKHNINYWQCGQYYGFGLSASGYINGKRYTNTFNFKEYLENPYEKEFELLEKKDKIEEEIFLGLRIIDGIDFEKINKKFDIDIQKKYKHEFEKFLKSGLMKKTEKGVKLSVRGILISNEILSSFL